MNVVKHLSDFINSPDTFVNYETPLSSVLGVEQLDRGVRSEMVKTFALATHIHEEDFTLD